MIEHDIQARAVEKLAGLMDGLGEVVGNQGTLNTPMMGIGGGALGAMAGMGAGAMFPALRKLGPIAGGLLGGGMGAMGSNAINSQNNMQNNMDMGLLNGIGAGLGANDQTDSMQSQALMEQGNAINSLAQVISSMIAPPDMGMGMDPNMMDPNMMDPNMMDPNMMGTEAPTPQTGQIDNNGLGKKASVNPILQDIENAAVTKIACLIKQAEEDGGSWLPSIMGAGGLAAGGVGGAKYLSQGISDLGENIDKEFFTKKYLQPIYENLRNSGMSAYDAAGRARDYITSGSGKPVGKRLMQASSGLRGLKNILVNNPKLIAGLGGAGTLGLGAYGLGKLMFD